jgi:hypothetical protein
MGRDPQSGRHGDQAVKKLSAISCRTGSRRRCTFLPLTITRTRHRLHAGRLQGNLQKYHGVPLPGSPTRECGRGSVSDEFQWVLSEPRAQASGFFDLLQVPLQSGYSRALQEHVERRVLSEGRSSGSAAAGSSGWRGSSNPGARQERMRHEVAPASGDGKAES